MTAAPAPVRASSAPRALALLAAVAALLAVLLGRADDSAAWTYERVTPTDKSGGGLMKDTYRAAPDGSALLYSVTGSMAGVPAASSPMYTRYLAKRGESGWVNQAVDPPWDLGLAPDQATFTIQLTLGSSENLEWIVQTSNEALTPGATQGGSNLYALDTRTGERHLIVTSPSRNDFTNVIAQVSGGASSTVRFVGNDGTVWFNLQHAAVPEAPGATVYRWHPVSGLEAVGRLPLDEGGDYVTGGALGHTNSNSGVPSPIPPSFSTGRVYLRDGSTSGNSFGNGVYMLGETGADPMVALSRDRSAAATGVRTALLHGSSEDGRYAVFRVVQQGVRLTDDTPDLGGQARHIYRYDSETDTLLSIGATRHNQWSAMDGVQKMTPDGKTIFFLSQLVQAPGAVDGRSNLYVWREGESLELVRTSDVGSTGAQTNGWLRVMSSNGRYFMFTDNSFGIAQQFGYDNRSVACSTTASPEPCDVVYRYDIEDGELDCVSCRPDGELPAGHAGAPLIRGSAVATMPMDARQVQYVADDGTVFFDTADPLVAEDLNGETDTYAWRDGEYRLVSRAAPGERSRFIDATPDGRSVFFATADAIVPSDIDRSQDIYVARLDGGFVESGDGAPGACQGADCREPAAGLPGLAPLGSVGFAGGGNVAGPDRARVALRVKRRNVVAGSVARLRVRVPGAGRVSVAGRRVRRAAISPSRAGTYVVRVALRPRARRALMTRRKALRAGVRVSFRARGGQRASRRVTVKFKQPKAKRAATRKGGRR